MKRVFRVVSLMLIFSTLCLSLFASGGQESVADAGTVIVCINESPWLPAFRDLAKQYTEETGISVDIRAFPFQTMSERGLSATTSSKSEFDVITINESMAAKFYSDGLFAPIKSIDPDFSLDSAFISYDGLNYWDSKLQYPSISGDLYSIPVNGNIQVFYYRKDLYDAAGLDAPETWDDVKAAAKIISDSDSSLYGYAVRGQKGHMALGWDFYPYLRGFGGDIFKDAPRDMTVTMNTPEALEALTLYAELAQKFSPPGASSIGQSEQIALLAGGQLIQTLVVAGANAQMDREKDSVVPGAMAYTVIPKPVGGTHAAHTGVLSMGIPQNIDETRQVKALNFLKWVTSQKSQQFFAEHGGVPVRTDAMESNGKSELRILDALKLSGDYAVAFPRVPYWPRIDDVLESRLSEVVAGMTTPSDALSIIQGEIEAILIDEGIK